MPKITKLTLIYVLAFFILEGLVSVRPSNAQDARILENGLRVIIREDHRSPIVVFSAFVGVGAASEAGYFGSGISHLTEHMLFKGSRKYPTGAIEDILHKYGGEMQGFTSHDYTGFRITILKEHEDVALDILREVFTSPEFDAKELEKEKRVIEREMALNRDDPGRRLSRLTFAKTFTRHPYKMPVIGYKDNFGDLGRDDLLAFFRANYTAENIVIAVAGDIDKKAMFSRIEEMFGAVPRGKGVFLAAPREPEQIAERDAEEASGTSGAYLNVAFHSTALLDKDLYAMDLLSFILGQGESSILNQDLRIEKELALSISAYNYTPRDPGLFIISAVLKEERLKEGVREIIKILGKVKEEGVSVSDMEKAKNNFVAERIYEKETIESQADDLALGELLAGDPYFFEQYTERVKSVTSDDVLHAARKYLTRDNMTVVALSPSGNALGVASEKAGERHERVIERKALKNGLPVLVSENPSLPMLSIYVLMEGGLRLETAENNGISKIVSLMLTDGTDVMSREDIARQYESKAMSLATYSANNSLGLSVTCLKEYAEEAMALLSHLCFASVFPEEELRREKNELKAAIDMQDDRIFSQGSRLLKKALFKEHPYRFQAIGTHESVDRIRRDDVTRFYGDIFSSDNMVLGLCGDFGIEEIMPLAEKYFSTIPSKKRSLAPPEKEGPINKTRKSLVKSNKEQSLVLIGFHGTDVYDKDRYSVEIMVDMLSGESGALFNSIRQKEGLSYATGAFQVLGTDPGYIAAYTLTSKNNIDRVRSMMFDELASFAKRGPSDETLQKSKNHLKAMRRVAMQRNSSFIFMACLDELYGLGYEAYRDYNKRIDRVTGEDVKEAAKRLLTTDRCAVVILEGK